MIRVVLVDDHAVYKRGLKELLENDPEIIVVGDAGNGKEAVKICEELVPDLVLMDIRMPICDGVIGTKLIKEKHANIKVIVLTTFDHNEYITQVLKNGADGYILKGVSEDDLITTIKSTMKGLSVFEEKVMTMIHENFKNLPHESGKMKIQLNEREIELLKLIIEGKTNKESGSILCLAEGTIRNMISSLLSKFSLKDRTQLAVFAIRNNII